MHPTLIDDGDLIGFPVPQKKVVVGPEDITGPIGPVETLIIQPPDEPEFEDTVQFCFKIAVTDEDIAFILEHRHFWMTQIGGSVRPFGFFTYPDMPTSDTPGETNDL